ncbi:hypothetical protein JXJ21_12835 [candidate division KSB1 bacterium]|nr:hypothetical protein [candidate division KSB1 bacterium]
MPEKMQSTITVNFSNAIGTIRAFHGINSGPISFNGYNDSSEYYTEIGFPTVRLHDCPYFYRGDIVDVPYIFPFKQLDPNDPDNYAFQRTDDYLKAIIDCGCDIVYRLGVSIEGVEKFRYNTDPPEDVDKWITICANIIRHYNYGWANGFEFGIRYWEIWNEPDNGPVQWNSTFEEFVAFYIRVAKALKAEFPEIMIGGPAFNGAMRTNARNKIEGFLPYLKKAKAPLDFLSWHVYPRQPGELIAPAREVRDALDAYGFHETESHLNEWNLGPVDHDWVSNGKDPYRRRANFEEMRGPLNSALVAACLTGLQDAPVDMTNFYHGSCFTRGLFDDCGIPHKPFYAFRAYKRLLSKTPKRCAVEGSDPDNGLAVLAGISDERDAVQLMLTNYASDHRDWTLKLEGLPEAKIELEYLVIDETRNLEPAAPEQAALTGMHLNASIPAQTVCLVSLKTAKQPEGCAESGFSTFFRNGEVND